jgi:hypothetical protein
MAAFTLPKNSTIIAGVVHKAPADATKVKAFKIYRWDPGSIDQPQQPRRAPSTSGMVTTFRGTPR